MDRFYSSLIINYKKFPLIHQVFKPRYNRHYFKRIDNNIEKLNLFIAKRCKNEISSTPIDFKNTTHKLVKLKELHGENVSEGSEDDSLAKIRDQIQELEDHVMPFVLSIPNRLSKDVPTEDDVIAQIESSFLDNEGLSKVLSYTKLSYINNCYSKSIVGPNSYYYYGIGSKLQQGLTEYFTEELEKRGFLLTSGLCLTKSAVVEAANSRDVKDYASDPSRILEDEHSFTTLHAVEASRESLLGFVTTLGRWNTNNPLRFMASGMSYRQGSSWFDSDEKRVSQFGTVHILTLTPSIEKYSIQEYLDTKDIIWDIYKKLELPARLVHCCSDSMISNEYDAYKIEVWMPSKQKWIQVSRLSHYRDYLTVRTGMKRGHIIDSMVYDAQVLVAAIIENRQTSTGHFIIPSVIQKHMLALTESELTHYFRQTSGSSKPQHFNQPKLSNYDQRRYFSKRNYVLSHSQKAYKNNGSHNKVWIGGVMIISVSCLLDWTEIWYQFVPTFVKRPVYDYLYRPARRLIWHYTYTGGTPKPPDLPFDEMDKSHYEKTMSQRRKEHYHKYDPPES